MIRFAGPLIGGWRLAVTALVWLGAFVIETQAAAPCMEPVQCRSFLTFEGRRLPFYTSIGFDRPQPDIRRALIMVHGMDGNAEGYFRTAIEAARMAGRLNDTVIIAPRFIEDRDSAFTNDRDFFWSNGADWRAGDLSDRDHPPRVSSFELMGRLLAQVADEKLFPCLSTIVLAGHSAGAQLVQRYAIGAPVEPALARVMMRYVVANPGSYLYLDENRADAEKPEGFGPFERANCAQFNRFKYGFERPNAYFKDQPVDDMITRYRARSVVYLLGETDINPDAENLSRTCAAMAQGATRFVRGKTFVAYMEALFWPHNHRMVTVPGVGHSARSMFQSTQGIQVLFRD